MTETQAAELLTYQAQILFAVEWVLVYLGVLIIFVIVGSMVKWK